MNLSRAVYAATCNGFITLDLQHALENRTREELRSIVAEKINGTTALINACVNGHLDLVRILIEDYFADIEEVGFLDYGERPISVSPLFCAVLYARFAIVQYLIEKKANVNSMAENNSTPLNVACSEGDYDIARLLIMNQADMEIANSSGCTCLMTACLKGHHRIVDMLIDEGADINRKSATGTCGYPFLILFVVSLIRISKLSTPDWTILFVMIYSIN